MSSPLLYFSFTSIFFFFSFFFNDTATTEIYTLSLHDALPIFFKNNCSKVGLLTIELPQDDVDWLMARAEETPHAEIEDRKSTRLNSSHSQISYAVFCLKKKKKN